MASRNTLKTAAMLVLVLCVVLTGCKDDGPQTELDKFINRMDKVEGAARNDTLAVLADGSDSAAVYSNYLIGNRYYITAGDSAAVGGWNLKSITADLDTAEVYFSRAVALDSTFIEALVNLGSLWDDRAGRIGTKQEQKHRYDQAEKFYRLALEVDPFDEKAHCNLGSMYLAQRRSDAAVQEFNGVLAHNPRSSLAHYHLAIMFAEAEIYQEAITEWELAAKFDPSGDIGQRAKDNVKIIKELMNTKTPPVK